MTLEIWTEVPFSLSSSRPSPDQIAKQVLGININLRGDVLFSLNAALFCYTLELGYEMFDCKFLDVVNVTIAITRCSTKLRASCGVPVLVATVSKYLLGP
jgi:hypothetical protein